MVDELEDLNSSQSLKIACISTPSVYFSLSPQTKESSSLFDIDESFKRDKGFIFYDFNQPETLDSALEHTFDIAIVDPPFITREVWEKYTRAIRFLLKDTGKMILSSIDENAAMLNELLGVEKTHYQPSIPHLVYQYSFFTNYSSPRFSERNQEIPDY